MRFKQILVILVPLLTIAFGCAAYNYVAPYKQFDHEKHEMPIVQQGKDCFFCHDVTIAEKDQVKRVLILRNMLKESDEKKFVEGTCHTCHIDRNVEIKEGAKGPSDCYVCHDDLRSVMPDDHNGLWVDSHGNAAKEVWYDGAWNPKSDEAKSLSYPTCDSCHAQWFCADCHTARDLGKSEMHPRTFKTAHVAAAAVDPASCSSCHTARYCRDCHAGK
ncbi:MAG: hypothetical protein LBV09_03475 [Deferribacteraceae bacterium]|jgi:hypothetical protein|nr:hypothetical protein [Deferribacteraceae bacterium]